MKKNLTRRVAALLGGGVAAATLAACGGASTGASGDTVQIGAILPLTGDFSTYGGPLKQAAELAVDRVNEAGGIEIDGKSYQVKLKVYDDATAPEKNIPQIFPQAVLRDQSPLLITAWNSANVAPFLEDNPVPVIDVLAATLEPPVNSLDENIFLLRPYTPDIVPGVGAYLARDFKVKKMAYLGPDEPFANGQLASLQETVADNGISLDETVQYPADASDLSSFIRSALESKPDAIHVGGSTQAVAPVLAQLHQLGYDKPVTMYTGMTPDQAKDLIGPGVYNDVMANVHEFEGVTPQTNPLPAANQFGKDFEAEYDTYGIDLTQWAYDAVWIAKAAMEKAGTVDDPEKIRDALTELTVPEDAITGWIEHDGAKLFNEERQASSLSVGLTWNQEQATWDPDIYFTAGLPEQKVTIVDPESLEQ
jgi:branched-chain amino acid transport system substrate-binding protein